MTSAPDGHVIADEAAREKQYSTALARKAELVAEALKGQARNTFTDNPDVDFPKQGFLVGRVALKSPDNDDLDGRSDFYIGSTSHDAGDYQVFSWAAPVACAFYRKSSNHHDWCDDVAAIRILAHQGGRIADFQDELVDGEPRPDLFPRQELVIPQAPPISKENSPQEPVSGQPAAAKEPALPAAPPETDSTTPGGETQAFETASTSHAVPTSPGPPLRAPELLRRQLAAPKTSAMSAVLATLQSDQYEAITRPVSESVVLQGHPGTGKTIIATHRAAYLLDPELPEARKMRSHVLILGPTEEYVSHVQGALRQLVRYPNRCVVRSIPDVLDELAGLPRSTLPTQSVVLENVSLDLARLVDQALKHTKHNLDGEPPTADDVYAELLWFVQSPPDEGLDREWFDYLKELPPSIQELRRTKNRAYRSLLAYIGVRTTPTPDPGHVIVDEAQDIHPIEWEILGRLGNTGGWTILGDLNQRRTDHTFGSWEKVAEILAIENEDGTAPTQVLERSYRSTSQIIRFANQLLPARDRNLFSLQQDGEPPTVQRVTTAKAIWDSSFTAAMNLVERFPTGTVAVITVDPQPLRLLLRDNGWSSSAAEPSLWTKDDQTLRVLTPDRARGLEFDAVVVIEPADFPENFGRQGVLYTALTRANRSLTVIHHRALPQRMKARL